MQTQISKRNLVLYTRYSSELQSSKSCDDQERQIREELDKRGIDHRSAVVIKDEAQSGTKSTRPGFLQLLDWVNSRRISVLAVDDLSRLTRASNAKSFIDDLIFSGGRFISFGEGIDTEQESWQVLVQVLSIHNSTTIKELGRRVRRCQAGRILGGLTAGDYIFGYESFLVNPTESITVRRGAKPEKNVRIKESAANWVRKIFKWFIDGRSMNWIAKNLNELKAPRGHRTREQNWCHQQVSKILRNEKYIGNWIWGKKTTILIRRIRCNERLADLGNPGQARPTR